MNRINKYSVKREIGIARRHAHQSFGALVRHFTQGRLFEFAIYGDGAARDWLVKHRIRTLMVIVVLVGMLLVTDRSDWRDTGFLQVLIEKGMTVIKPLSESSEGE